MSALCRTYIISLLVTASFALPLFANEQKASVWMIQGIRELKAGNYANAAKQLGKAAEAFRDPSQKSQAWYHQGIAYFNWEQWGSALDSFEEAKKWAPDDLKQNLNYYIGHCYERLGHDNDSISYLTTASKSAPSPEIRFKSDFLLNRLRKHEKKRFSVLTDLAYIFDSNVILETPSGTVHGTGGFDAEYQQGQSISLFVKPGFYRPVFKKSMLSLYSLFYGQWYIINSLEQFNFLEISPQISVSTPVRVKHVPVEWVNAFNYQVIWNTDVEDTNDIYFNTIKNVYMASTSARFIYSPWWDLTMGMALGYVDSKEGDGSLTSSSGRLFRANLSPAFKSPRMIWNPGYAYSAFLKTGEKNKFRKHDLSLRVTFPFFFNSLALLEGNVYYTSFPEHQQNRRDIGGGVGGRVSRFVYEKLGMALYARYMANKGRHVESSFRRYLLGTDLFYTFD